MGNKAPEIEVRSITGEAAALKVTLHSGTVAFQVEYYDGEKYQAADIKRESPDSSAKDTVVKITAKVHPNSISARFRVRYWKSETTSSCGTPTKTYKLETDTSFGEIPEKHNIVAKVRDLNKSITEYNVPKMKDLDLQTLTVLLIGPQGAGKSSFVSAAKAVLTGSILSFETPVGSFGNAVTQHFVNFAINGCKLHITDSKGVRNNPHWREDWAESLRQVEEIKPHVVVIVLNTMETYTEDENLLREINAFRYGLTLKGYQTPILLTHCDELDPTLEHNPESIYKSHCVRDKAKKIAANIGGDNSQIYPAILPRGPKSGIQEVQKYIITSFVHHLIFSFPSSRINWLANQAVNNRRDQPE